MQRRGIALFITIGIITAISALILASFSLIENGFKNISNIEKMTQTAVVIKDISGAMKKLSKEIKDAESLYMVMGTYPPLADEDGRFSLQLELLPQFSKININSILAKKSPEDPYEQQKLKEKFEPLFENIVNRYELADSYLLLNYILDTLDTDEVERDVGTEIVINRVSFLNGVIANWEHFREVLTQYEIKSEDRNIWSVPWREIFYFGKDTEETLIDCNYMSKELAILLTLEFDEYFDQYSSSEITEDGEDSTPSEFSCDLITGDYTTEENERLMKLLNIGEYKKGGKYHIVGDAYYQTNSAEDSFSFIYELKSGRIIDIELKSISTKE